MLWNSHAHRVGNSDSERLSHSVKVTQQEVAGPGFAGPTRLPKGSWSPRRPQGIVRESEEKQAHQNKSRRKKLTTQ